MTTFEMQQLFETLLQTSSPLYNDAEKPDTDTIFRYLNEAQIKYIKDKYLSGSSFEDKSLVISRNLNDLKNLIYVLSLTNVGAATPYYTNTGVFKSATYNVWHYMAATCKMTRTYPYTTNNTLIDLEQIGDDKVNQYLTTSINTPIILLPVFAHTHTQVADTLDNQLAILIIRDKYTTIDPLTVTARCLIEPSRLVLDSPGAGEVTVCQIADYLHEEIVRLALALFEGQKYKLSSKKQEVKND